MMLIKWFGLTERDIASLTLLCWVLARGPVQGKAAEVVIGFHGASLCLIVCHCQGFHFGLIVYVNGSLFSWESPYDSYTSGNS